MNRRFTRWALIFIGWTVLAVFYASQYSFREYSDGRPLDWGVALLPSLVRWYTWAGLTLGIVWLTKRFPLERSRWPLGVSVHVLASVLFPIVQIAVFVVFFGWLDRTSSWTFTFNTVFSSHFRGDFHLGILTYWAILAVYSAIDYYGKFRQRELRSSQLESQLAQAQLQTLRMQLQPHFLFNTLNAIIALIHKNPDAAERILVRLSDLLRLTLDNEHAPKVSLKQELEFLQCYLDIEQIRFGDRLTVQLCTPAETLSAQVPNLLLQPLVENAVQHGISQRSNKGRIVVKSSVKHEKLTLTVRDNGPGFKQANQIKHGIGLSNTRKRLRQLYGDNHRFEFQNAAPHGVEVIIIIPLEWMGEHHL